MAHATTIELHPLAAEAGAGSSAAFDIGVTRTALHLALTSTATTGGAATVTIETSPDGSNGWRQVVGLSVSGAGTQERYVDRCERYVRAKWTPVTSATFQLTAEAHQLYVTRAEAFAGNRAKAIESASDSDLVRVLIEASGDAETALNTSYLLPITKIPLEFRRRIGAIAFALAMDLRGWKPTEVDELIIKNADDAQKWLKDVAAGRLRPPGLEPPTPLAPQASSGNYEAPDDFKPRMSDNWGDF